MTTNSNFEPFNPKIDLTGNGSVFVTGVYHIKPDEAAAAELKQYDIRYLFVKSFRILPVTNNNITVVNPTIYIQDTIEHKTGNKIAGFLRRIDQIVADVNEMKKPLHSTGHVVPNNWREKSYQPTITVSVKCNDMSLGDKSHKVISKLDSMIKSGIKIEFLNKCTENSPWNQIVQSMISQQHERQ